MLKPSDRLLLFDSYTLATRFWAYKYCFNITRHITSTNYVEFIYHTHYVLSLNYAFFFFSKKRLKLKTVDPPEHASPTIVNILGMPARLPMQERLRARSDH